MIHNSVGRHNPGVSGGCILSKLLFCERMQISIYYFKQRIRTVRIIAARKEEKIKRFFFKTFQQTTVYNLIIMILIRLNKYS